MNTHSNPELNYENIFQISSRKVAYIPIFQPCDKSQDNRHCHRITEYRPNEVEIDVNLIEYKLPDDFLKNSIPAIHSEELRLQNHIHLFSKCRLLEYKTTTYPSGHPKRLIITLSEVSYIDYLRSGEHLDEPLTSDTTKTFRDKYAPFDSPIFHTLHDFKASELTNICGVGVFLITSDNKIIISKHSKTVDVCAGLYSYSASGTMDWNRLDDFFDGSPNSNPEWKEFLSPFEQVERECIEEINHYISEEHIKLIAFGIDTKKLYFQFSFIERTSYSSDEIIKRSRFAPDFHKEMDELIAVNFDLIEIINFIRCGSWEPAAEATLLSLCAQEFGLEAVERIIDSEFVENSWKNRMKAEWTHRASYPGELAVMSKRYPHERIITESQRYVSAVMAFMGLDISKKNVVEFGAGIGRLTEYLVHYADKITCIEFCEDMIKRNKVRLGNNADQIEYIIIFGQDYCPSPNKHDVAICSLVLIHNVDEWSFKKLVDSISRAADTIFIFEDITEPGLRRRQHTRIRNEQEIISAFSLYRVEKKDYFNLFEDRIVFLKLVKEHKNYVSYKHEAESQKTIEKNKQEGLQVGVYIENLTINDGNQQFADIIKNKN